MTYGPAPVFRLAQRFSDVMWASWAPLIRHKRGHDAVTAQRDNQGDRKRYVDVPVAVRPSVRGVIDRAWVTPARGRGFPTPPIPAGPTGATGATGLSVDGDPS